MNFIRLFLLCFCSAVFAAGEPLHVGVQSFDPPFVIQGSQQVYGFDVDMMNTLCKIMNRSCQFHIMEFRQLFSEVAAGKIDVAVSSITIMPGRFESIDFSLPYLASYSRFLTSKEQAKKSYSVDMLNNKHFGIVSGTVFADEIAGMGIKNPTIKEYDTLESLLEGLQKNEVAFIMVDNPTALYWEANSATQFSTIGPAYLYGNGFGIAINRANPELLRAINAALVQYRNSPEFKANFNKYMSGL
jgi:polar amino acid transport system substrate-binding protein